MADKEGYLPLHVALDGCHPPRVSLLRLLVHSCYASVKHKTLDGYLPLHLAMKMEDGPEGEGEEEEGGGEEGGTSPLLSVIQELICLYPESVHEVAVDVSPLQEGADSTTWKGPWRKHRWTPMSLALSKGRNSDLAKLLRPYRKRNQKGLSGTTASSTAGAGGGGGGGTIMKESTSQVQLVASPRQPPPTSPPRDEGEGGGGRDPSSPSPDPPPPTSPRGGGGGGAETDRPDSRARPDTRDGSLRRSGLGKVPTVESQRSLHFPGENTEPSTRALPPLSGRGAPGGASVGPSSVTSLFVKSDYNAHQPRHSPPAVAREVPVDLV